MSSLDAQPEIITVGQRNAGASTILGGTVVPYREVTLTAQLPGRVQFIAGREGDRFQGREMLLALSDDALLAKREQALANYNNSLYALRNSQMQYGREWWAPQSRDINRMPGMGLPSLFDQFFTRNVGSGLGYGNPFLERYTDLYSSGIHVAQAQGNQVAAMSQIREVDARLRDSVTIAPFDGVIVKKMVEPGDTVQPGQPLLKYADLADLQLSVEVPSRLVDGLQEGMIVPAILDYNNQYVDARISRIYPMSNSSRHTITVKFDLPLGTNAWPGTYAEVMVPEIDSPTETLIEIPKSAVVRHGSLPEVYVIKDNRPQLHLVRLGASYAEGRVTVLAGLKAGDRILARPPAGNTSDWNKTPQGMNE
ncbi:MAG: efflux RND transporter periplasmic adaptor subunit [Gammaproteobacteria bacterium]|nr:efflux RND transporter periplasmic adaptor subunit [Gammaproteobacteria bacterium]